MRLRLSFEAPPNGGGESPRSLPRTGAQTAHLPPKGTSSPPKRGARPALLRRFALPLSHFPSAAWRSRSEAGCCCHRTVKFQQDDDLEHGAPRLRHGRPRLEGALRTVWWVSTSPRAARGRGGLGGGCRCRQWVSKGGTARSPPATAESSKQSPTRQTSSLPTATHTAPTSSAWALHLSLSRSINQPWPLNDHGSAIIDGDQELSHAHVAI